MAGGNVEKGNRYIAALEQARSQGKWDEVPELIRKVTKHAPQRICVIQTATAESRVIVYLQHKASAETTKPSPNLLELIPALLVTIGNNDGSPQEILQAQVCLGWVHWALNEPALAAARLPKDFAATVSSLTGDGQALTPWTEVCLVKGCYIKATAQSTIGGIDETLDTFAALEPWLSSGKQASVANAQFLNWSETLLGKGALMASKEASKNSPYSNPRHVEIALRLFRQWAVHPAVKQGLATQKSTASDLSSPISRTTLWNSYYGFLTIVLQDNLTYPPPSAERPGRPQQAAELRRVETICEGNLLREVKFPTASSGNSQVEEWVERVISNWEILCGPHWQDDDLGEGGQTVASRNVLDMLYRAAAKTYHSHLVLRRLFHVHAALAEFDLAIQAFDSYIEIVTAAKDRAEKSAEYGELERDEILLQTLSEGVMLLSCLGSFEEAEKAKDLTELIRKYTSKHVTDQVNGEANGKLLLSDDPDSPRAPEVSLFVLATAYRAVGVGLANWASWTPMNESRDDIRGEAIEYLEKSISPDLGNSLNNSSIYTLALVLAENRDLDSAIDYVKSVLSSETSSTMPTQGLLKERDLVSLWHLLALLLSAKHEFDIAEHSCEAAFEQFPREVFSTHQRERRNSRHSHHGKDSTGRSVISQLQGREKERIIQTRITQLAFVEILEGPEAAVNQSEQLLSLFGSLFHDLNLDAEESKPGKQEHLIPPKTSGTTRSFRGSIFHRNRASQMPDRRTDRSASPTAPPVPTAPNGQTNGTEAPTIQVTDEDRHNRHERSSLGRSDSKKLRKRSLSAQRNEKPRTSEPPLPNGAIDSPDMVGIAVSGNTTPVSATHSPTAKQPLRPIAHNFSHAQQPSLVGHGTQTSEPDVQLPVSHRFNSPTNAITKFSMVQSQKHALGLLVNIWLIIAGLYRRASLFDDAREACEEASKQAGRVEALVASQESSARSFNKRGWGVAKSSEELWADVYAEQGLLTQAQSKPREAIKQFEEALLRNQHHPTATIALANLLLDIWDQTMPPEPVNAEADVNLSRLSLLTDTPKPKTAKAISTDELKATDTVQDPPPAHPAHSAHDVDPKLLQRLAARDRAYGLLSSLTKLGSSWDNSEAWYALSRAYEAGDQVDKLKSVLWWCIELEDRRPIRHWSNIGSGLYVL
ncbi:hypothetical protein N7474_002037 [Penicillium riverlandense]|uniref:uncharacterized protein n=1 Tax=Penicillium riverlandense TaxID=1903569 RepID=UPI0025492421|nr:uncharacterized protein N7474_002037 [Penicillium riverlandense]KAJ5833726.1 hypothetical protein N7474_002037 [Penicillium riverlandense]